MKRWMFLTLLLAGCSEGALESDSLDEGAPRPGPGADDGASEEPTDPGEVERFRLSKPASTANRVFVANETTGTVAIVSIDGGAIRINTVRAGARPTVLLPIVDEDAAVVLNQGSSSLTLVRAGRGVTPDSSETIDILAGCNRLALSPDADLAFAWYDDRLRESGVPSGALSVVSVVPLRTMDAAWQISVGVNVHDIVFSDDGERALLVSDEGVSEVALAELAGDTFAPPTAVTDPLDPLPLGASQEVLLTPDGELAVVRTAGSAELRIVSLSDGQTTLWQPGGVPTDIDLLTDGRVLVSVPELGQVLLADLQGLIVEDPEAVAAVTIEEHPTGQTTMDAFSSLAVIFSAPASSSEAGNGIVSLLTLDDLTHEALNLRKGVTEVIMGPAGRVAIALHTKVPGSATAGASEAELLQRLYAISVVDLSSGATKLIPLSHFADEVVFSADEQYAWVMVSDEPAVREVVRVNTETFRVDTVRFDREPQSIGYIENVDSLYVSQDHELGRIAFISAETLEVREVTGFELNGLIE
ncbi:MAG: hypothetical protein KGO50_15250 [Myxococcales bacterium]|nr:hypothetical protein [Myxococcales bacterium]